MKYKMRANYCAALVSISALLSSALALNGDPSKTTLNTYAGWKSFEVVTQGDALGGYTLPGQMDGIGAYLMDGGTAIRVFVNHETPYDCDIKTDSSVSEIIISKANLKSAINNVLTSGTTGGVSFINSIGLAYENFRDKNGNFVSGFGGKAFKWFCSGQVHKADTFGSGYGFVDRMYIFGEEADASAGYGRFFAIADKTMHMITGAGTGDATSIQGGRNGIAPDALENVAMVHTGEKGHVALMFSPDYGEKKLRMYIGKKGFKTDGTSCGACTTEKDFLARNGLAFGSWFYLQASLPTGGGTQTGSFGTNSASAVTGTKLEDIDASPNHPTKVVLAEQLSGVYELDFTLAFSNGVFSAATSSFTISKLPLSISSPDNVEWCADDSIFVCSDNNEGAIHRRSSSGVVTKIAATKGTGESELLDLDPASVLLVNSMTCPTSMSVIVNPLTKTDTSGPTSHPTNAEGQPSKTPTKKPTASPVTSCGNGICELNEYSDVCQADCGSQTLTTNTVDGSGAPGAMFQVKAVRRDIKVTSLSFFSGSVNTDLVEVYTRPGEYIDHELSQDGWEL
eukprot:scaffold6744_cov103-Alexandrium_tamarense.AAC.1